VRYGGKLAENAFYRVMQNFFNRDDSALPSGQRNNDDARWRTVFAPIGEPSSQNLSLFKEMAYYGDEHQTYFLFHAPPRAAGVANAHQCLRRNVMGAGRITFSAESELKLQAYYDLLKGHWVV